ncbi:MAG: class I SAM-dependent methyltransferase [Methanospirillum sp.]|uniref:class I SAM-dependent methyltransferase n=1 Tax=Methanospirillum sp. TaxID=45200 RepID=UPI00237175E6|nr:class I SAM-dependent methyltransferase [Methanospirillum sp.]MDD1728713.1 class I SAM-dependent methyltransferase [Methanospirillum sp.]
MNISKLKSLTIAPPLDEPGTHRMWDDPYISGQLLRIHLNQETDAASRKPETIIRTVNWIESFLKKPSSILDLGCGPGLYDELFAERGHRVTGIDYSLRSVQYAKEQAAKRGLNITYLHQNYLDLTLENRYDLVIMIYCDFSVLNPDERDRLLHRVFHLLNPGGLFIFDVLNEHAPDFMNINEKGWEISEGGFWKLDPYLALSQSFHYQTERVILQQHIICTDEEDPEIYRFWNRYYQTGEMAAILKQAGFSEVQMSYQVLPEERAGTNKMVTFYSAQV